MIKTHKAPSHTPCSRGFTLIELLTVIAIIAILAAILIPAVSGVRLQARETAKRSAYRQMFIANNMYAIDNNGMTCLVNVRRDDGKQLHWYYLLSLTYIQSSNYVTYNEACILSSALFFYGDKTTDFALEQSDLYAAKILRPVNVSSISESTAIPLETVRRSIGKMIKKNLLRKENNDIYVTDLVLGKTEIQMASNVALTFLHDILNIACIMHTNPD